MSAAFTAPLVAMLGALASGPVDDYSSSYAAGERVGRVLGPIIALGLFAWLFFLRQWREGQSVSFFFRLGVLLVPFLFAWGTLRSGFLLGARLTAFLWLAFVIAVGLKGDRVRSFGQDQPDEIRAGFVKGCMRNEGASEEVCGCLADRYTAEHSIADLQRTHAALKRGEKVPDLVAWVVDARAACERELKSEAAKPGSPDSKPVDPNAPPPEIAKTACQVTSTPAGAALLLDGQPTGKVTPASLTIFAGRKNVITASLAGHLAASATVSPDLGQGTEHHFDLVSGTTVKIATQPAGAGVWFDGVALGPTPLETATTAGAHTVILKLAGRVDAERTITVVNGKATEVSAELFEGATLQVNSVPNGAEIAIDGVARGFAPNRVAVAAGANHFVTLTSRGYLPAVQKVPAIAAGQLGTVTVTLRLSTRSTLEDCSSTAAGELRALGKAESKAALALRKAKPEQRSSLAAAWAEAAAELAAVRRQQTVCAAGK